MALLFVGVPILLFINRATVGRYIIPGLLVISTICLVVLRRDPAFDRTQLWNRRDLGFGFRRMLRMLLVGGAFITALVAIFRSDLLFNFPRERPQLWVLVMIAYPVFSVYPQEIIYRTFLFHRYRPLFPESNAMVWASGLLFGWAHILFGNWIAPTLTAIGGVLFARTYLHSRSTLQSSLEHALWGDFMFTVGLGAFFYGGRLAASGG